MAVTKCELCQGNVKTEELDTIKKLFPEAYSLVVCSFQSCGEHGDGSAEHFKATLKMKLSTEEEIQKWLEDFQASSGSIWKKSKTYPIYGLKFSNKGAKSSNKYRVDLRCQHHTRWTGTYIKRTKNTFCPATMYLILKKAWSEAESCGDKHIKQGYVFHVILRNEHNHGEALNYKPVSRTTVQKLTTLYQSGHTVPSALLAIKHELREEHGDSSSVDYLRAAADRSVCPEPDFCYRLYEKLFKKACLKEEKSGVVASLQEYTREHDEDVLEEPEGYYCCPLQEEPLPNTEEVEAHLMEVFEDIRNKLKDDPTSFHAPVRSFVENYKRLRTDRTALVSSLTLFANPVEISVKQYKRQRGRPRKSICQQNGIQGAEGLEKSALRGRRGRAAGRPSKASRRDHPYKTVQETKIEESNQALSHLYNCNTGGSQTF